MGATEITDSCYIAAAQQKLKCVIFSSGIKTEMLNNATLNICKLKTEEEYIIYLFNQHFKWWDKRQISLGKIRVSI